MEESIPTPVGSPYTNPTQYIRTSRTSSVDVRVFPLVLVVLGVPGSKYMFPRRTWLEFFNELQSRTGKSKCITI